MQQRACKLAGSDMCSSIRTQIERFNVCGFSACQCLTLTDYYTNKLDKRERTRVESLEFLDENELLIQLLDHYCVCVAGNFMEARELFF
jgi:[phosphatase 2A protein]-leucine-carboxy methyltransferase